MRVRSQSRADCTVQLTQCSKKTTYNHYAKKNTFRISVCECYAILSCKNELATINEHFPKLLPRVSDSEYQTNHTFASVGTKALQCGFSQEK